MRVTYANPGVDLPYAVNKAKLLLDKEYDCIYLIFNDIRIRVAKSSYIDDLFIIYELKRRLGEFESE